MYSFYYVRQINNLLLLLLSAVSSIDFTNFPYSSVTMSPVLASSANLLRTVTGKDVAILCFIIQTNHSFFSLRVFYLYADQDVFVLSSIPSIPMLLYASTLYIMYRILPFFIDQYIIDFWLTTIHVRDKMSIVSRSFSWRECWWCKVTFCCMV